MFENPSVNESDAQFLKKFEYLKIHDTDHPRYIDEQSLISNKSISKRENQFLNKEVLSILNASLDIKKKMLKGKNNKSNINKYENSSDEISSIVQGNSNNEFSQSDFSIGMEKKERDLFENCTHNTDSQSREKNNIKSEKQLSKNPKNNRIRNSKNLFKNNDGNGYFYDEKALNDPGFEKNNQMQEQQFDVSHQSNEFNEKNFSNPSSNTKTSNDKVNYNIDTDSEYTTISHKYPLNNLNIKNVNNDIKANKTEKYSSKKNGKNKKDKKSERESQSNKNHSNEDIDFNVNNLNNTKFQNKNNECTAQRGLYSDYPLNNQSNFFTNQFQNAFVNNNNKIHNNNYLNNQIMQNHLHQNHSNNNNNNKNFHNNQMFINPCYFYNQNNNGHQNTFSINMPFNQYPPGSVPYNMMNNPNNYYPSPSGFNSNNGNQGIYHVEHMKMNPNLPNFDNPNRILTNQNNNRNQNYQNNFSNNKQLHSKHVEKSLIAENLQDKKKQEKNKIKNFDLSEPKTKTNNRKLNESVDQESEAELITEHLINQNNLHKKENSETIFHPEHYESKNHKQIICSSEENQIFYNYKYQNLLETKTFNNKSLLDLNEESTFNSTESNSNFSKSHYANNNISNSNCDINIFGNNTNFKNENDNSNKKTSSKTISEESYEDEYDEKKETEHILDLISKKKFSEISEKDLIGNLLSIARDQTGCRFLQQRIDDNPNFANFELYSEIQLNISDFICDPYGNYLVQKMLDSLTTDKINHLTSNLVCDFYFYATNPHATRIIQKLLDIVQSNKQIHTNKLFEEIKKHSLDLFKDINGIHVIQKIIKNIPSLKSFIFAVSEENLVAIATNKHGCCAMQKCLEISDKTNKATLIELIIKNSIILMTDQYGNYVIQFVLSLRDQNYIRAIINTFKDNIEYLSKQKYASNVIEKCFDNCSEENKLALVLELANPNIISELIVNNFGNFVLQKAMKNCRDPYYSLFITVIGQNLYKLKKFQWGPKLYNKILDNFSELQAYVTKPKQKC